MCIYMCTCHYIIPNRYQHFVANFASARIKASTKLSLQALVFGGARATALEFPSVLVPIIKVSFLVVHL